MGVLTLFFPAPLVHNNDAIGTETIVFSWLKMDKSRHILMSNFKLFLGAVPSRSIFECGYSISPQNQLFLNSPLPI